MDDTKILDPNKLSGSSFAEKVHLLLEQQKKTWPLAKQNYLNLENVLRRTFEFDGFTINVQFNPGRMISSSAKVDSKTIKERPCFLCLDNLPQEQVGLSYNEKYLVLVNPFPIFDEHLTIPTFDHQPQQISLSFPDMIDLSREFSESFTLFYNGPKCGASAPDHLHFQACLSGVMSIENELGSILKSKGNVLFENSESKVISITNYLRNLYLIESDTDQSSILLFKKLIMLLNSISDSTEEPMVNVIMLYKDGWKTLLFPRKKHRPTQYFLEGGDRILISPAAVDFGGQLITPREEDFDKITKDDIVDIFEQTTLSNYGMNKIDMGFKSLN